MDETDITPRIHIVHRLLRARDWQDRPAFGEVREWWREGPGGVCALVGIGGAGKTAIADRFVRCLPGVLATPDVAADEALAPPRELFLFSFYRAPNPDTFFGELAACLGHEATGESTPPPSYTQTIRLLEQTHCSLIVLDGLETVQDTGERSGFIGRILDSRLRDMVLRAADGLLPGARFLITSRFELFDALVESGSCFRAIPVEELTAEASIALLRRRGVRGPDHRLEALAREQGFHALSVDLLGGYIARFAGGDPARFEPDAATSDAGTDIDPRIAALHRQRHRLARLAERYSETLRDSDPAALALLQRACFFRLGVDVSTLASIFTGKDKDEVAGAELAGLDETGLKKKLAVLVEMKLLECVDNEHYHGHPAVRDGFLKNLDEKTLQLGHEAAREGLESLLAERLDVDLSELAKLDILEEIVYHTLAAGHVEEAWEVYSTRIGSYENLGRRLGAYEQGERICRAFAGGRPPEEAPLPDGLTEPLQAAFVNEWAMYLWHLGRLAAAARCCEQGIDIMMRDGEWKTACAGHRNLTDVMLATGQLTAALESAEKALHLADRSNDALQELHSYAFRAHARALRGKTPSAIVDFRRAFPWQHAYEKAASHPLDGDREYWQTLLLARLGRTEEATRLTEAHKKMSQNGGEQPQDVPRCNLVLADLARERHDLDDARQLLDAAYEWAIARDAKEPLCWAALVRARLERTEGRTVQRSPNGDRAEGARSSPNGKAHRAIEDGLRIARDCGFSIYHIDLLLIRARLALEEGDVDKALSDIGTALFEGVYPPEDAGMPVLLAATDPKCGYSWGEVEGRQLRGEALLLQAVRQLGRNEYEPSRFARLPENVREIIDEASQELEACQRLRQEIQDPKMAETKNTLARLYDGVLAPSVMAMDEFGGARHE